uniref:F-box domain-containing protein n=1 Tax=Davidia involucrata TaxID=16924 RepID=A0A5B7BPX2_DAVIN
MDCTSQRKPKRKFSQIEKKQNIVDVNDNMDWISELPEPIIHQILSRLRSKDVARTSVLSKKWRDMWASFLTFNFDQKSYRANQNESFKDFVENSLSTRLEPLFGIQKFRLYMTSFNLKLAPRIDRWISAATSKNVKELEIHLKVKQKKYYSLPQTVLTAETITSLKLYGCRLDICSDIKLAHLRVLSIKKARINAHIIESLIGSCPLIQDLRLVHCSGLECLHVSGLLELKRIEVHECHGLKSVEIEIPNLQTFWYYGKKSMPCKINLAACENLKNLTLKDPSMTDELFQEQISKFSVLEDLVLKECSTLERITVLSEKLERLALIGCRKLEEANIDAPNLLSFEYTGDKMPFSSMSASSLHEAKLYFQSPKKNQDTIWFDMLQKFLGKFDQSKVLKLVVQLDKNVIIYEELKEIQLLPFFELKLDIIKSSWTLKEHVDTLLRMCHPKTLSVVSSSSGKFLKFLHEKIMNREGNPNCCRYYTRKCWQHYLEDVEIEKSEGNGISGQNPWLKSSPTLQKSTSFKLNWRSNKQ